MSDKNSIEYVKTFCIGFGWLIGCALIMGIFGAAVCYYVFGIIFLVEDYDKAKECKTSDMWAYVLVLMIIGFLQLKLAKTKDDDNDAKAISIAASFILNTVLIIWGGVELFDKSNGNDCIALRESDLYTFTYVIFIILCTANGIVICTCMITIMLLCCEKATEETYLERYQHTFDNIEKSTSEKNKDIENIA